MAKDIFKGCFGIGWLIIIVFILAGILAPEPYGSYIYVLFFFVIGGFVCIISILVEEYIVR